MVEEADEVSLSRKMSVQMATSAQVIMIETVEKFQKIQKINLNENTIQQMKKKTLNTKLLTNGQENSELQLWKPSKKRESPMQLPEPKWQK